MNNLQMNSLCRRVARLQARGKTMAVNQEASNAGRNRTQHTGTRRGRRRLFEHMRDQGEQVETLWESGKTIRHLTREEGQDTWNERGKLVNFQNETGNDETRHETERKS